MEQASGRATQARAEFERAHQAGLLAGRSSPERNHRVLAASPDLRDTGQSVIPVFRVFCTQVQRCQVHNTANNTHDVTEPCLSADPVEKPKHCLRVDFGLTR